MSRPPGPKPLSTAPSSQALELQSLLFDAAPTTVYRARTADGRQVVLKSLRDDADPLAAAAGIQHEYDIVRALDAEHVVRVYGVELGDDRLSLVLEDFGGHSLDRILAERPLSLEEVLHIGVQVAGGLAAIHAANIIHKDINPSNVVYNAETRVAKIIDFGIASYLTREQADMGSPSTLEGSLPYVSPEQTGRMNRAVDYRTDFYSLGATLYELLSRRRLFEVDEPIEWLHCHIAREPLPLTAAGVPAPVWNVVARLLAKSADDRYRSATGIRTDLERCLADLQHHGEVRPFRVGEHDLPDRFQIRQHLYGRERETARLMSSFERASTGAAELVLVGGYSGIGKTCLIKELYRPITSRRGLFVSGKFDQLHRNVPLSALVTALRSLVRQLLTEPETQLALWRQRLGEALDGHGRLITDLIPDLTLIIGEQPAPGKLAPQAAENLFRHTLVSFVRTFARRESPLVIFLDDLQWADAATLGLLELLLTEASLDHLLVIGAYRDNEVHAAHPMMLALNRIQERARVDRLTLTPLDRHHLIELLMDALHAGRDDLAALAELVEAKTGGNPYFTEEFLKDLYRRELITYDRECGRWAWDAEAIAAEHMTDNVVDLLAEKLHRLSAPARDMLQTAACIGHRFELGMLVVVCGWPWPELARALREAMQQGLIAPLGRHCQLLSLDHEPDAADTVELAFAHDRIQQAAHALLDEQARQQVHLRIGRILISHFGNEGLDEHLFRITDHLNTARPLIAAADERRELTTWNRAAGDRARRAAAFDAAAEYYATAVALLEGDAWSERYGDTLKLYTAAADCACLSGRHGLCDDLITEALCHAGDVTSGAGLHRIRMKSLIARGEHARALELGRWVMSQLGHAYPRKFLRLHLTAEYLAVRHRLRGMTLRDLRALPRAATAVAPEASGISEQMSVAAQVCEPLLLSMMAIRGVQSALEHGISERAIVPFGGLGVQLGMNRGETEAGETYSRFARELCEEFGATTARGRVHLHHYAYLAPWMQPLREIEAPLLQAYEMCLQAADFDGAAQALNFLGSYATLSGRPLAQVREDLQSWRTALSTLNQREAVCYADTQSQLVANLLGESPDPLVLKGAHYDIGRMLPEHERHQARRLVMGARVRQALLLVLMDRPEAALPHLDAVRPFLPAIERVFDGLYVCFHDALARLAVARNRSGAQRRRLLRQAGRHRRLLRDWATRAPTNAEARRWLVEAEWCATRGNEAQAQTYYDRAITAAREHRLPQDEGQANQLAAHMHLRAGRRTIAEAYLDKARDAYQRWGAVAVVAQLEATHETLLKRQSAQRGPSSRSAGSRRAASIAQGRSERQPGTDTGETVLAAVDVTALMKALKAIVEERVHSRMIRAIIDVAMEFAGAQRGLLMLRGADHRLRIEAEASVDDDEPRILQSVAVNESRSLSQAVVNYVARTLEAVVVHDAQQPGGPVPGLNRDPHVREHQVSSILCLPLVASGDHEPELIGMLYLENNLTSHTFTEQRFDALEIICMAAAGRLELSRKAAVDGLTGLYNRDHFQVMLHQELMSSQRHGRPLSLIMADVDHFKDFNDTWGHQVGDEVLQAVASVLRTTCRESDVVARYGGEELAVILPDTGAAGAQALAERLRQAVESLDLSRDDQTMDVTISIGVATATPGTDEADLLRRADAALYQAKGAGRNRVQAA